ncbi:ABC transporter ATP-binding protein [Egicoccus halophilus]|uniref:ABC transporter ATP-binding protein n=1 Tax=Egicoccus halophilus TaxID=1670830 RepID=A0A8J3ESU3_9ACTN|nr:ABC transporter ATP-binding protein [Egicoccus halophilus]GGI04212.1 ABC transporter ATP-binding protein [Egicoccus halophilus]
MPPLDLPAAPAAAATTAVIVVERLHYRYPGAATAAVENLSFRVAPGEVLGFLGPSGAGKSTTQQVLTGRLRGGDGHVRVLGVAPTALRPAERARIGVSFEQPALYPKLTAREQLTFFAALGGGTRARDVDDLLGRLGLADHADQRVGTYSKGMRTRLDLARALLHRPEVLLLDEPTGGLDPASSALVRQVVADERDRGAAVLLTTHDMELATALADRVALLAQGRLAASGTPRELVLAAGERGIVLTTDDGRRLARPLHAAGSDPEVLAWLRDPALATVHTTEPTLGEVFVRLTGQSLRADA